VSPPPAVPVVAAAAPVVVPSDVLLAAGLDELKQEVVAPPAAVAAADVSVAVGAVTVAGYVLFSPRTLLWAVTAVLARPAVWRAFDPLEVVYAWEAEKGRRPADGESLQSMVGG
jgi:hypothetical protein